MSQTLNYAPHSKNGINLVKLVASEIQLFLHPRDVCIVKVSTVYVTVSSKAGWLVFEETYLDSSGST